MSKFTVMPHEWTSAEACLKHLFSLEKSLHLFLSYPAKGGGRAGSYQFITENQLKDRVYSVSFSDNSLSIDFHDMVYIHHIPNRNPMDSYNCKVRITIPSDQVFKDDHIEKVRIAQNELIEQKKTIEAQRLILKAHELALKASENNFVALCETTFSLESLIGHTAYIWDVGSIPFELKSRKETLHSSSKIWFENLKHPKLIKGEEANKICSTTVFNPVLDYAWFILSSELHDVYNYVIIDLNKKC